MKHDVIGQELRWFFMMFGKAFRQGKEEAFETVIRRCLTIACKGGAKPLSLVSAYSSRLSFGCQCHAWLPVVRQRLVPLTHDVRTFV